MASAQAVSRYSLSVAPDFARSTGRVGPIDGIIGLPTGVEVVAEPAVEPHRQTTPPRLPISRILTGHGAPRAAHRSWASWDDFLSGSANPCARLVYPLATRRIPRPTGSRSSAHCQPALRPASARTGPQVPTKSRGFPSSAEKNARCGRTAGRFSRRRAWVRGSGRRGAPSRPPRGRTLARSKKPLNRALNGSGAPTPHRIAAWGEIFKTNRIP